MIKLQEKAVEMVNDLIPNFKELEFSASIGDSSRSIEFIVSINNERHQCYELADTGIIDEDKMEKLFDAYAEYLRGTAEYKKGEVNKFKFTIEK